MPVNRFFFFKHYSDWFIGDLRDDLIFFLEGFILSFWSFFFESWLEIKSRSWLLWLDFFLNQSIELVLIAKCSASIYNLVNESSCVIKNSNCIFFLIFLKSQSSSSKINYLLFLIPNNCSLFIYSFFFFEFDRIKAIFN